MYWTINSYWDCYWVRLAKYNRIVPYLLRIQKTVENHENQLQVTKWICSAYAISLDNYHLLSERVVPTRLSCAMWLSCLLTYVHTVHAKKAKKNSRPQVSQLGSRQSKVPSHPQAYWWFVPNKVWWLYLNIRVPILFLLIQFCLDFDNVLNFLFTFSIYVPSWIPFIGSPSRFYFFVIFISFEHSIN